MAVWPVGGLSLCVCVCVLLFYYVTIIIIIHIHSYFYNCYTTVRYSLMVGGAGSHGTP